MLEQILGLPAHPLLVHAAVIFVPLLALASVAYAVVPRLRPRIGWAVVLLALAGAGSSVLARFSGVAFRDRLRARDQAPAELLEKLANHQQFGDYTMYTALGLAAVVLVFVWAARSSGVARQHGARGERPRRGGAMALQVLLGLVILGLAGASLYYVVRTGDSGARIVWQGS